MRKWGIIVIAMVAVPWAVTLCWIRASGIVAEAKTSYEAESYEAASHGTTSYETAGYGTSGYGTSGHETSGHEMSGHGTSDYGTSGYETARENGEGAEPSETLNKGGEDEAGFGRRSSGTGNGEGLDDGAVGGKAGEQGPAPAAKGAQDGVTVGVSPSERKRILMERDGIKTYMDLENFLPGVIACQIPSDGSGKEWDDEVWKCQAVIARTYISRLMEGRSEIYEEELDMDYLGESRDLRAGDRRDVMDKLDRARQAARATEGIVMKYEGRCILPLFHEMSAGRTRTGEDDFPYIVSVDSGQDTKRPDYITRMEWTAADFAAKINQIPDAAPVTADQLAGQIQTVQKDGAGYVLQMKIGAKIYTGDDIQYALGLPSPCFGLEADGNMIRAVVRGRGHGYGLSQSGAESMAGNGWSYEDILNHYYKNISLIFE